MTDKIYTREELEDINPCDLYDLAEERGLLVALEEDAQVNHGLLAGLILDGQQETKS